MNSRERVRSALARKLTDRVPVFMWFHPETTQRLARLLEIPAVRVAEAMGNDIRQAWVNNNYAMEGITHERDGETHVDYWGIEWVKEGPFNQIARFPLAGASAGQVLDYKFPYDYCKALLQQMAPVIPAAGDVFIGCDVSPCVFEMYWRLRGMETAITEIAAAPQFTREMFRRCADFAVHLSEIACERFPLDWLWTGDDVAAQQSLIMSPRAWQDLIKPELARVFAVGKAHGLPVAYHCCGALRPIIGDLIEIGMDVLNPIQCHCPGMAPEELKREFGEQIAFMGGVDTQDLLPNGSAEDVQRETARLIETMTADGGGYILAASHTIPPETPDRNIFALYAAAGLSREEIFDRAADIRHRAV
jgi:uroporphyrinogen decarboxylase